MILIMEFIFFFQSYELFEFIWICFLFKMFYLFELNECKGKSLFSCFLLQGFYFDFEYLDMYMIVFFIDNIYNILYWNIKGNVVCINFFGCIYMCGFGKLFFYVFFMFCVCFSLLDYILSIL